MSHHDWHGFRERWRGKHDPFEFFFFGPRGGGMGMRFRKRMRRGDIRVAILEVLAEKPRHGYDIILALEERERGNYRPSPGSVYPTLQMLEDGGFVTSEQIDGKRVYTITEAGRAELARRSSDERDERDDEDDDDNPAHVASRIGRAARAMRGLTEAVVQAMRTADAEVIDKVLDIVNEARKDVYGALGDAD